MNKKWIDENIVFSLLVYCVGFQILRDLLTHLTYNFELSPESALPLLLLILLIFGAGAFAGSFLKFVPLHKTLLFLTVLMAIARLLLQFTFSPMLELVIGIVGTIAFFSIFSLLVGIYANRNIANLIVGTILGINLETGIHGVYHTFLHSWRTDILAFLLLFFLLAVLLWALRQILPSLTQLDDLHYKNTVSVLGWGSILFLNWMFFQNIALLTSSSGLAMHFSLAIILFGNLLSLGIVLFLLTSGGKKHALGLFLGGILFVVGVAIFSKGDFPPALFLIEMIYLNLALSYVLRVQTAPNGLSIAKLSILLGVSVLALGLGMIIYYVGYLIPLPFDNKWLLVLAAISIVLFSSRSAYRGSVNDSKLSERAIRFSVAFGLSSLIFPLLLWVGTVNASMRGPSQEYVLPDTIKILSYNIHNGFDIDGNISIDEQIQIMKNSEADIIALQEVSRGWPINGSFDTLTYIQSELQFEYRVFMPTADAQWGVALLSRFPIKEVDLIPISTPGHVMERGFIWANIEIGSRDMPLIVTHLHHLLGEEASVWREIEVSEILDYVESNETMIILGDLNAEPGTPEINLFDDAGYLDAQSVAGHGDGLTFIYGTYVKPIKLDYIFGSEEIEFIDLITIPNEASDHLGILAEFDLP